MSQDFSLERGAGGHCAFWKYFYLVATIDADESKRSYVFCGGSPLTREHVFPQWLASVLPEQERFRGQDLAEVYPNQTKAAEPVHREMKEKFTSTTVRRVCAPCNHGWMGDLERAARPTLTRLIQGELLRIRAKEQACLAFWAAKTSLMFEFTNTVGISATPDQYKHVFDRREPPST